MAHKSIYMGTTKIEAEKTAGEITQILVRSGARQIAMDYDERGFIKGLRFILPIQGQEAAFSLPVRTQSLLRFCRNDAAQARRVAWRQLLRWVEAQLAMIDVGMVKPEEVYAPYLLQASGMTLFEALCTTKFKALPAPEVKRG